MEEAFAPYVKKLLDGGIKTAEDVAKFIEVQSPELFKETIMWGAVSEMIAPLFGIIVMVLMIAMHFTYRKNEDYYKSTYDNPSPSMLVAIIFFIGLVIFMFNIMDVVYPIIAPRLYILEKVGSLIK